LEAIPTLAKRPARNKTGHKNDDVSSSQRSAGRLRVTVIFKAWAGIG
jgi:hypothetical protein